MARFEKTKRELIIPETKKSLDGWYTVIKGNFIQTNVKGFEKETVYCKLTRDGMLWCKPGFCWNGPSSIAIDTVNAHVASEAHDCLYKLIGEGHLPKGQRKSADSTYRECLANWGVSWWRRASHYRGVRLFGGLHT